MKGIFGGQNLIHARLEDGSDVYRITLRRVTTGWEWQVQGADSQHPAGVLAVMQERIALGDALPDSPMEVGEVSLIEMLEERLGRALGPAEDVFVDKLEKRYRRWEIEQKLFDHDLVRLSPKWTVTSYEPINIWPSPPRNVLEFWTYIAAAFIQKKVTFPRFMECVTQTGESSEQLKEWERTRELELWQARMQRMATEQEIMIVRGELRAMVSPRDVKLQYRRSDALDAADPYLNFEGEVELSRLKEKLQTGAIVLDTLSEALLNQWQSHWPSGEVAAPSIRLEEKRDREFLGRLLRQPALNERVVSLDETTYSHSAEVLCWVCEEPAEDDEDKQTWILQLSTTEGIAMPYAFTALPGPQTLYLGSDAIYEGPGAWMDGPEMLPRYSVPKEVLESSQGLEFLRKLDVPLPESLKSRVRETLMVPRINMRLGKSITGDAEMIFSEVTGSDTEGLRKEALERDAWQVTEQTEPTDGRVLWFDRRPLYPIAGMIEDLGLGYDHPSRTFRLKLSKVFPNKFVKWLERLPEGTDLQLDKELDSLRADPVSASVRFELSETGEIDWFDLKVLVQVEGMDLSKEEIRQLVEARGGFVRMANGTWLRLTLQLTESQEAAINQLGLDVTDLNDETHRLHVLQLAEPRAGELFDAMIWNRISDRATRLKLQVRPPVPENFQLTLRPYQVEGFHFLAYLASNNFGGILADDMGLGKTAQAICWLLWLQERSRAAGEKTRPAIVVAPKSVLDVWAGETVKFAPSLRVQVIRDKSELDIEKLGQDIDVVVLNYSQLRVNAEKLKPVEWLAVVLDEGQQIKNPDSLAARAARELQCPHRLVLSGTPIENRLLDVWSLMAFAMPGVLGNRSYFRSRFDKKEDAGCGPRLSARLRPFLLRRTKSQVALDLPSRTEEDIFSTLDEGQDELYQLELVKMQRLVLGLGTDAELRKNSFAVLQGLMRLRQICCHPGLIDDQHMDKASAKMTALFYLLDQLREANHKVLVFSQFTSMLDIIKAKLTEEGRPHLILTGQTKDRHEVVRTFHTSKEPHVFLLSLKAGGTGLNLTAASYVVLYDPWWNPAVENQAIDRTHRIGQTNPVIAYRLLARNTVEEKIRKLQAQKQMMVTGVLGEESFTSNLTLNDVKSLFLRDEEPMEAPVKKAPRKKAAAKTAKSAKVVDLSK